jgi:putative membrane protein
MRQVILILLGIYLFVYPFGIVLICLDIMPAWGTWMGGALLIIQGATLGVWLMLNYRWRGVLAALAILLLSWAVEHIGVTTGFPFGGYHYTDILNLKVLGVVPLAVPFAWLLVIPSAMSMTDFLLHRDIHHPERALVDAWRASDAPRSVGGRFVTFLKHLIHEPEQPPVEACLLLTRRPMTTLGIAIQDMLHMFISVLGVATFALLLDLLIEPVAVHINGYWVWNNSGGGYYGVPGSNFAAWWVTSVVLATILVVLTRSQALLPVGTEDITYTNHIGGRVYQWLPPLLYILNLTMFSLVTLAHGKLFAGIIGSLLLFYLALAWFEPRLVRWIMGEQRSTTA